MFPHRCTVSNRSQQQTLTFTTGTAAITAGQVVTGAVSHASGTVLSVTLTGGAWAAGTAAGALVLSGVTGTFGAEAIVSATGAARATGPQVPVKGSLGTPTYSWSGVSTPCEFYYAQGESAPVMVQGETVRNPLMVKIPASIAVAPGTSRIVSAQAGYVGTFAVDSALPAPGMAGTVHHYECQLSEVPA